MAMDTSAADSYVYAKASGMLAKSHVGERARILFSFNTLQELWSHLFKKEVPLVPETLLAQALEQEAFDDFVLQYKKLIENYSKPKEILLSLLHGYDYENLKDIAAALSLGEKKLPQIQKVYPFNIINYDKWPDLKQMTAEGPLAWYDEVPSVKDLHLVNHKIDSQNVIELWNALKKTESSCRKALTDLFAEKLSLDNFVWSIRLRLYYGMEREHIVPLLAYTSEEKSERDVIVQDALKSLDWALDDFDSWKKSRFSKLLNLHEDGVVWSVDPVWISNAYKAVHVEKARRLFHQHPFTSCPMVCWFIIKQNELDNIRTAAESLRLNIDSQQAMKIVGIAEVNNG